MGLLRLLVIVCVLVICVRFCVWWLCGCCFNSVVLHVVSY